MGLVFGRSKTKDDFRRKKETGVFRSYDPKTGKIREQGRFENGIQVGLWKEYDSEGDEIHFQYSNQRIGAVCKDGTTTKAVGRGAGSHHGGVAEWLFTTIRSKIGGTGKYMPIEQRVQILREKVDHKFKICKQGLQFEEQALKILLNLTDKNNLLETEVQKQKKKAKKVIDQLSSALKKITTMKTQLKSTNKKIQELENFIQTAKQSEKIKHKRLKLVNRSLNESVKQEKNESSSMKIEKSKDTKNLKQRTQREIFQIREDSFERVLNEMRVSENLSSVMEKEKEDSFFSCEQEKQSNKSNKEKDEQQFPNDSTQMHIQHLLANLSECDI